MVFEKAAGRKTALTLKTSECASPSGVQSPFPPPLNLFQQLFISVIASGVLRERYVSSQLVSAGNELNICFKVYFASSVVNNRIIRSSDFCRTPRVVPIGIFIGLSPAPLYFTYSRHLPVPSYDGHFTAQTQLDPAARAPGPEPSGPGPVPGSSAQHRGWSRGSPRPAAHWRCL